MTTQTEEFTYPLTTQDEWAKLEPIVQAGDLGHLSWPDRWAYYQSICEYAGLSPLTRPFDFITDKKGTSLFPNQRCAGQLIATRRIHTSDPVITELRGCVIVTVRATAPNGASCANVGVKAFGAGQLPENTIMHATTKALRRAVIAVTGLGAMINNEDDPAPGATILEVQEFGEEPKPKQIEQHEQNAQEGHNHDEQLLETQKPNPPRETTPTPQTPTNTDPAQKPANTAQRTYLHGIAMEQNDVRGLALADDENLTSKDASHEINRLQRAKHSAQQNDTRPTST